MSNCHNSVLTWTIFFSNLLSLKYILMAWNESQCSALLENDNQVMWLSISTFTLLFGRASPNRKYLILPYTIFTSVVNSLAVYCSQHIDRCILLKNMILVKWSIYIRYEAHVSGLQTKFFLEQLPWGPCSWIILIAPPHPNTIPPKTPLLNKHWGLQHLHVTYQLFSDTVFGFEFRSMQFSHKISCFHIGIWTTF